MARLFASGDDIRTTNAVISGTPFTVNLRLNFSATGSAHTLWCLTTIASDDHYFSFDKGAADTVRFRARTTASSDAISTATLSASTEYVLTAVATSATDRKIYINGTNDGSNTTSRVPTGMNTTAIGRQIKLTAGNSTAGTISEVTVWNVALTQDEITQLSLKYSGLTVRPASIVSHLPLVNDIIDPINSSWAYSATGTTVADHVRVQNVFTSAIYPKKTTVAATAYKSHMCMMGVG